MCIRDRLNREVVVVLRRGDDVVDMDALLLVVDVYKRQGLDRVLFAREVVHEFHAGRTSRIVVYDPRNARLVHPSDVCAGNRRQKNGSAQARTAVCRSATPLSLSLIHIWPIER